MTERASTSVHFRHNTDLDPGEEYLASVPRIRVALANPALLDKFREYDAIANAKHRTLWRTGLTSLWLAGLGLLGMAVKLLVLGLTFGDTLDERYTNSLEALTLASEVCAIAAIVIAVVPFFARTRRAWLAARFMTERIRQWHFQLLLDGELLARARSAPREFETERTDRWMGLLALAPSAEGGFNAFVDSLSLDIAHPATESGDDRVDAEVCRAYRDLRIEKQKAYFEHKREEFAAKDDWSEGVAKWTLFTALALAAAQIALFAVDACGGHVGHEPSVWMSAGALALVVVSMCVRVWRNAIGVTEQRERYESKFVRLESLRAAFEAVSTMTEKRAVMQEIECLEIEELREFLRQARKASFVL
jgi:hypothetical protein